MSQNKTLTTQEIQLSEEARILSEKLLRRPEGTKHYITEKEIGRGAMGVVNLVHDQDLHRTTAMKVVQPQLVDMYERFSAFVSEARLTAELEHPNIVPVHELGIIDETGTPFYTMKLVEGKPLNEIIDKLAIEDPEYTVKYNRHALLNIFRNVCNAIAYAHSHNVLHRDIKPENIMIGQFGEVLVMDWGLAKKMDHDAEAPLQTKEESQVFETQDMMKTQDGMIKGSPAYISPEQAFGDIDAVDEKTDIFLLGSTLYHMFTHSPPYEGSDILKIIGMAETCDFPAPNERNPRCKIPSALERIICKAMAPLKENRYKDVNCLIESIDSFITGRPVSGRKLFSPGQNLIEAGKKTDECYVIVDGTVEVHRDVDGKKITIATVGCGEIIGEMSGITQTVSSATVTAITAADTLVITPVRERNQPRAQRKRSISNY